METPTVIATLAAAGAALAGGLSAGQMKPFNLDWIQHPYAARMTMLKRPVPGKARKSMGAALLACLLAAGALAAYAAEPSAPECLPQEVVGVVGSGDQLSLKVAEDQQVKTIKPGGDYRDGWKVKALTNTTATLSKGGETRQVGLNPTGALPAAPAAQADPSQVAVAGDTIDAIQAANWKIFGDYWAANGGEWPRGPMGAYAIPTMAELQAFLGPTRYQAFYDDQMRLDQLQKMKNRADAAARGDVNAVRFYDGQPVAGPDQIRVAPDQMEDAAARAVGLESGLGYAINPQVSQANGVITLTKCNIPDPSPMCANQ